jgi:hypothetical protein
VNGFPKLPVETEDEKRFRIAQEAINDALGQLFDPKNQATVGEHLNKIFGPLMSLKIQFAYFLLLVIIVSFGSVIYSLFPSPFHIAIDWLVSFSPFLTAPACIFAACLLYKMRRQTTLLYGGAEILFGVVTLFGTLGAAQTSGMQALDWVKFVGGLYVIVRGLDNIGRWTNTFELGRKQWEQVFGKEHMTGIVVSFPGGPTLGQPE